jgi:hypothetical protein
MTMHQLTVNNYMKNMYNFLITLYYPLFLFLMCKIEEESYVGRGGGREGVRRGGWEGGGSGLGCVTEAVRQV